MDIIDTTLEDALRARSGTVIAEASGALLRARMPHYDAAGSSEARWRIEALLDLVVRCVAERTVLPICSFAEQVATERFRSGFDIGEVQAAFNLLEEAIWRVVLSDVPPGGLVGAAGLVGTVLGAGKDALARTWVSLAARQHVTSLDVSALLTGTSS